MPHDMNDVVVKVGDRVLVPAIVQSVETGDQYCNVTVVTTRPMPPYENGTTVVLNTRQVCVLPELPPGRRKAGYLLKVEPETEEVPSEEDDQKA